MIRALLLIALTLQAQDADKEAADLLKKVEERLANAKTVHIEFEALPQGAGREQLKGEIKLGGNGTFIYKVTIQRSERVDEVTLRSDGKVIVVNGPMPLDVSTWTPQRMEAMFRKTISQSALMGMMMLFTGTAEVPPVRDIKSEGREKVGEIEAAVVSFTMDVKERHGKQEYKFRQWIDPKTLTVLKRTLEVGGREKIEEPCVRFLTDTPIPADLFQFQLPATLAEGQAIQVARSVVLFARFTGRLPRKLEELKQRPADLPADILWPDGGFWIGGAIPSVAYSVDGLGFKVGSIQEKAPPYSPVGAPTERLKKYFTARLQLQLIKAAAEGYLKAAGTLPKSGEDLVKKPEGVQFWPEGGWIGGGKIPLDPWGEPYAVRGGATFLAGVSNHRNRKLKRADVTPDERRALESSAMPAPTEKDLEELNRLIVGLGADKVEDREAATRAILGKGGGALKWVVDQMQKEKDPEVKTRLGLIRDQLKQPGMNWETELKPLFAGLVGPSGGLVLDNNERTAAISLKTLTTAQADFRSNDRDGNREMDFWVQDVAGLCGLKPGTGAAGVAAPAEKDHEMVKLIEPALAKSDTTDKRWNYPVFALKAPEPKAGYFVAALRNFESGGKVEPYDKGTGRHPDQFGFVVYPAEYGISGRLTFIINQENTIWCQDLQGDEIDTFPGKPEAEGWRKLD